MSIVLEHLSKSYDDHVVVNRVGLEVADGECFVLLGPSGSGKSTVLRIVAGLTPADSGRVLLHGKDVTARSPQVRGVGMVFQQYALFGHMSVADNIEFPLRIRRVGSRERARRRDELLELVGLVGFQRRFPQQLSGGQQQRVALARALAHNPEVLLLDEPFGALDARIRADLRRNLREIQRELRVTTIFVTHDQEEAVEIADRLGVMNFGRLLEVGTAEELYLRPQTEFVATFLGIANLFVGQCASNEVHLGGARFPLETRGSGEERRRVQVLFRPEDVAVKVTRDALDWPALGEAIVENVEFAGSTERLRFKMPAAPGVRAIAPPVPFGADYLRIDATRSQHLARRYPLKAGDTAWVGVRRVHALAHRGLGFAIIDCDRDTSRGATEYAGRIAGLCHARVTLLVSPEFAEPGIDPAQTARERLGVGLAAVDTYIVEPDSKEYLRELDRLRPDLVIVSRVDLRDRFHLLDFLVPESHSVLVTRGRAKPPQEVLLCTAAGEAAKSDILAAGRILRHLGAHVTILTVQDVSEAGDKEWIIRFHDASKRTLKRFGLEVANRILEGELRERVVEEGRAGSFDLVVLGAPPPDSESANSICRLAIDIVDQVQVPVLIISPGEDS